MSFATIPPPVYAPSRASPTTPPSLISPSKPLPPLQVKHTPLSSPKEHEDQEQLSSLLFGHVALTTDGTPAKKVRNGNASNLNALLTGRQSVRKPLGSPRRSPFGSPSQTLKRTRANQVSGEAKSPHALPSSQKRLKLVTETPAPLRHPPGIPPIPIPHVDLAVQSPTRSLSPSKTFEFKIIEPAKPKKKTLRDFGFVSQTSTDSSEASSSKLPALPLFATGGPSPFKSSVPSAKLSPSKLIRFPASSTSSISTVSLNDPDPDPDLIDSPSKPWRKPLGPPKKSLIPRRVPSITLPKPQPVTSAYRDLVVNSAAGGQLLPEPLSLPPPPPATLTEPPESVSELPPRPHSSLDVSRPFKRRTTLTPDTQASLFNLSSALEKLNVPRPKPRNSLAVSTSSDKNVTSRVSLTQGTSAARSFRHPHARDSQVGRPSTALGLSSQLLASTSRSSRSLPVRHASSSANRRASLASQALSKTLSESQGPGSSTASAVPSTSARTTGAGSRLHAPIAPRNASLRVLQGCVIFVDVRTEEGDDAGALFVDMLRGLGARILSRPTPSLTHIVFKSGHPSTLAKYRLFDEPKPYLVSIAWVVECVERRERVPEANFIVSDVPEWSRGGKSRQMNIVTSEQIKGSEITAQAKAVKAKVNIQESLQIFNRNEKLQMEP